jgi:hypothetical protein
MQERLVDVVPPLVADRVSLRYFASHASVLSTTHLCRPNFSLLSIPFLAMRLLMPRFLRVRLHFLSS